MTPSKPYFLRAVYEWVNDNRMTAHLLVNADAKGVDVPRQYVQDGRIVLNISPGAVHGLMMSNEDVTFSARFGGTPLQIHVPVYAILAIYAKENGQGMFFDDEHDPEPEPEVPGEDAAKPAQRPSLRVVK